MSFKSRTNTIRMVLDVLMLILGVFTVGRHVSVKITATTESNTDSD